MLLLAAASPAVAGSAPDPAPFRVPDGPGLLAPGLRAYHVPADGSAGTYRLLVIPVRFPEDHILGGGEEAGILAKLHDASVNGLTGFYHAATRGRLRLEATLGPTVVAEHARRYYTSEGVDNLGFGIDPDAYPHNAQSLVQEVTARVAAAVDFRSYDNTGDGIADGVLLLDSGPPAPEASGANDRTVMLAHAFTIPAPEARGDGVVFPYAIAATRDGIGVWAHEVGHLLGLPDLYVGNPYAPSEGVGPWSLMATGANAGGGTTPSGFDAASLLDLGVPEAFADGAPIAFPDTTFVRTFRAGEETGPEFFLLERRDGADGLRLPGPATLVYHVNQRVGDNRNPARPRVQLLAVVCAGTTPCIATLDDASDPPLHDTAGGPTYLVLDFARDTVTVRHVDVAGLVVASVRLEPEADGGRRVVVAVRNVTRGGIVTGIALSPPDTGAVCAERTGSASLVVPGYGVAADSSWRLTACAGGAPPGADVPLTVHYGPESSAAVTVIVRTGPDGLRASDLAAFAPVNLAPGRPDPWAYDNASGAWTARDPAILADAALVSPWFTVPDSARVFLDHAWALDVLAPDYAEDAVRVEVDPQIGPLRDLEPDAGWGYLAERSTGDALGGSPVLAGAGDRGHVIDLAAYARRTVRLRLRIAGDAVAGPGLWTVREVTVAGPPVTTMTLAVGDGVLRVSGTAAAAALYAGANPVTPVDLLAMPTGPAEIPDPGATPGARRRYDLVWRDDAGRAGTSCLTVTVPPPDATMLLAASPNPARTGEGQVWSLDLAPGAPAGATRFALFDAGGGQVAEVVATLREAGLRRVAWSGRDAAGRIARPGVYFLRCRTPDGAEASVKIVIVP